MLKWKEEAKKAKLKRDLMRRRSRIGYKKKE